jgi:PAS domain S-box-containing protein
LSCDEVRGSGHRPTAGIERKQDPVETKADELREDGRHMRLLNEAAQRLLAATDPKSAVAELFDLLSRELRLDAYFNYVLESDGRLHLANAHGLDPDQVRAGAALKLGSAVCGEVARDRRPDYVPNVQADEAPRTAFIRGVGLDCYACTPLIAGDRMLGTLGFGRRWRADFTEEELQLLRTVTHYFAMAFERLRTQAALRESERRLNAVLDNASVAVFLMDERQHCAYMNAAAERLTGYRFEETRGRPLHDVIHHTRPDGSPFPLHECAIDRAFPENNNQTGEEVFVHKDGSFYHVAFTASPIRAEDSETIGTIIEVRDITHEKRTEQARELLMREVDHRARNALSVVQSVVQLTRAPDIATYKEIVLGRVSALGRAQGSLAAQRWEGASVETVVQDELAAVAKPGRTTESGPPVMLPPEHAQPLGMLIHELATNAVKHGALGSEQGRVDVRWSTDRDGLTLTWTEHGGLAPNTPGAAGFGSRLIESLSRQMRAEIRREWRAEGLALTLRIPRPA